MNIFLFQNLRPTSMAMLLMLATIPTLSALGADAPKEAIFVNPGEIKWQDAPPTLPKGAKIAVLYGDPGKPGPFVMRLRAPSGYKIPPHWHTQTENLTIVSGAFHFGSADKQDPASEHVMKAGSYHYLPAKAHHYAYTKEATVVQIHGDGPFDIHYVNEADDPQKSAAK
ncbi:MAG: cupin domain-containing protein [Burkholderiaceae bacterium]